MGGVGGGTDAAGLMGGRTLLKEAGKKKIGFSVEIWLVLCLLSGGMWALTTDGQRVGKTLNRTTGYLL